MLPDIIKHSEGLEFTDKEEEGRPEKGEGRLEKGKRRKKSKLFNYFELQTIKLYCFELLPYHIHFSFKVNIKKLFYVGFYFLG